MDFVKMVLPSRRNTNIWLFGGSKDQSILKAKVDPPKASKMASKKVKFYPEIESKKS